MVIETKVSQPHEKVIGQITTYMAYVKNRIAKGNQKVRGIIVGNKISNEIKAAASQVPNLEAYEYSLSTKIKKLNWNMKGCPSCAKWIEGDDPICRYCGSEV